MSVSYLVYCGLCISVLKELNQIVDEPYMDEPFHIPQAQAYCQGDFQTWDPKITTPPGLYLMSLALKSVFLFKCNVPMLRLTVTMTLLALPIALTRLLCIYQRVRPPTSFLSPTVESVVLSMFPIAWFFGFLYYTEVPSVLCVILTFVAASNEQHWLAALLGFISCTFRQTNIIWVMYSFAYSVLAEMRFRRPEGGAKLHDPSALEAHFGDLLLTLRSVPQVFAGVLRSFVPYTLLLTVCASFVMWNGGIVLGDKSNHLPSVHIPQIYYFVGFATAMGWPVLVSGNPGPLSLLNEVKNRMFGSKSRWLVTLFTASVMAVTVFNFTIQHPFLLSDNRHYVFYVWRRVFLVHPVVPYMLIPAYMACAWAWFLRVGKDQTLLQSVILPIFTLVTLMPTPLLEPRYFLIPYILLRAQVTDTPSWGTILEGVWYVIINGATMATFLYLPREGVGRFMW
ncbi:glucosyltransferase [Mucidula mucida]|nr:glucosyltransferase [Mucidula mucida]